MKYITVHQTVILGQAGPEFKIGILAESLNFSAVMFCL